MINKHFYHTRMLIKLDCREKDLIKACNNRKENDAKNLYSDIKITSEQLTLGDIAICNNLGELLILIERKTLRDLAASISDGRYAEQGYRLNACELSNHNIIYLIEGNFQTYAPRPGGIPRTTLVTSLASISQIKGFSLYRTGSLAESAEWLLCLARKMNQNAGIEKNNNNIDAQNYVMVAKKAKTKCITSENIGQIMLMQIPSVSPTIANAIIQEAGSLKNMIEQLSKNPNTYDDLKITTATGKSRKVSKTAIQNILKYIMNCDS